MKVVFLGFIFLMTQAIAVSNDKNVDYKGLKNSLIDWNNVDAINWMDLENWKSEFFKNQDNPHWELSQKEKNLKEVVGRVLTCHGSCSLFRGLGKSRATFRSVIKEGDELETGVDSMMWVLLSDATLVRLSAQTSVSFNEINLSPKHYFVYSRVNEGHVYWLSRSSELEKTKETKQTDVSFLPLESWFESRFEKKKETSSSEVDFLSFLEGPSESSKIYARLHEIKKENNEWFNKESVHFVVLPNATLFAKNLEGHFLVLKGNQSYVNLKSSLDGEKVSFIGRGYTQLQEVVLEDSLWYEVDPSGKKIYLYSGDEFRWFEFLTKNIASVLLRRETMMKKYLMPVFKEAERKGLAQKFSIRLWQNIDEEKSELAGRIEFLKKFTRHIETAQLTLMKRFSEKNIDLNIKQDFDDRYYQDALVKYFQYTEK